MEHDEQHDQKNVTKMRKITLLLAMAFLMALPFNGYAQQTVNGDVNGDNEVNIADINSLIDIILGDTGFTLAADVNNDLEISIADVNAVIDIILNMAVVDEPEYVDLGLPSGTLWATRNVGADKPEDYGDYFAWGETEPKAVYTWETYKWCNGSNEWLTKYCSDSDWGVVDNRVEAVPDDDAAYVNWGPSWRMPTYEQLSELIEECYGEWTTLNGVNGYLFTGPNGNTIFLPAAGYRFNNSLDDAGSVGYYWTCTLGLGNCFVPSGMNFSGGSICWGGSVCMRCDGLTIRAVRTTSDESRRLYIAQDSLDLGDVPLGGTHSGELTIINYSKESRTVTVTADAPLMLKQEDDTVSTMNVLVPGDSTISLTVVFTATVPGELKCNVTFSHPAMDGGQCLVPVRAGAYDNDFTKPVDLGLPSGTLWAMCNVGASCPEDHGDYFAWGETEPKDNYSWETYKWCEGSHDKLTKYCTDSAYGAVDGKEELDSEDDAATANWGPSWRMPSIEQIEELTQCCTWQCKRRNGVIGQLVTGPNGNTIFLPYAGYRIDGYLSGENSFGYYWLNTLGDYDSTCYEAEHMAIWMWISGGGLSRYERCLGLTVRAVYVPHD